MTWRDWLRRLQARRQSAPPPLPPMPEDESVPEWLRGMQEGELRMRLICDLCGRIEEGVARVRDEKVKADMAMLIREHPEDALEAVRLAVCYAAGWLSVPLNDGGKVDICAECKHTSPWSPLS